MSIRVRIPTPLRKWTKDAAEVTAEGATVGEVMADLHQQFPGLKERLMDEQGQLRRFINVYLNEEDIRFLQGLATPVAQDDELSIIPAIAGGE